MIKNHENGNVKRLNSYAISGFQLRLRDLTIDKHEKQIFRLDFTVIENFRLLFRAL